MPCATLEKPALINAVALVSVELGVNATFDTTPTTASLATSFKYDWLTPVLSDAISETTCVTPDPATVVGPISVHAVPLYTYNCVFAVSNHVSPKTALVGCDVEFVGPPAGLNFVPSYTFNILFV